MFPKSKILILQEVRSMIQSPVDGSMAITQTLNIKILYLMSLPPGHPNDMFGAFGILQKCFAYH